MWTDEVGNVNAEDIEILRQYGNLASVILEKAYAQKQITMMAYQDALTGLPNRARLTQLLEEEMRRAQQGISSGMLLFIDLDDLKMINDNFGHTCGDNVITTAGEFIVSSLEEPSFVARMGGDEFIVLLPGVTRREEGALIADRLVASLQREYHVCGQHVHMSASIGATMYPEDAETVEEILKTADSAMYAAKEAGRNCWRFFESTMRDEVYHKMVMTNSLRRALERDELFLQYQPQLGLATGSIIGVEALVRWRSEEHGFVSPAKFIPLAEQTGLIQPIGEWVLRQACRFAKELSSLGFNDQHVAVNISPRQLEMPDFVSLVKATIEEAGISPLRLELEITETVLIDSLEDSIRKLKELQDIGVRLSLDDFGTGFSSLTYLRQLPVQTLKIDKSFIDRISEDELQMGFVASIVEMAHVLGLFVIAEGVETESQQQMLRGLACDGLQGYHFARPMDEAAVIDFLTATNIFKNIERK
jgi:diguanylate cyclase (GGDEF)-like protein